MTPHSFDDMFHKLALRTLYCPTCETSTREMTCFVCGGETVPERPAAFRAGEARYQYIHLPARTAVRA